MKKILSEEYKKYLPSENLRKILSIVFILILIAVALLFVFSKKQSFAPGDNSALQIGNPTISDLVKNDTDLDGIADWEEILWGTDKNNKMTFGVPDLDYINKRKEELKIEQEQGDKTLTETERFAQEFFTAYSAMQSSGADPSTINNFSNALGAKVGNPDLPNKYSEQELVSASNVSLAKEKYYTTLSDLFDEYVNKYGLGDELDIVSGGLVTYSSSGQVNQYTELTRIGVAYQELAEKALKIPVPQGLESYHLDIINSAYNTGTSILNMGKVISDPVVGISGVSQYQKYNKVLENSISALDSAIFDTNIDTEYENSDTMYYGDKNQ